MSRHRSVRRICPFDQRRAPREAGAHSRHQHELARPAAGRRRPRPRARAESSRTRCCRTVDVHDDLFLGNPSFLVAWSMMRTFAWCGTYTSTSATVLPHSLEHRLRRAHEYPRRELEHLTAVHLARSRPRGRRAREPPPGATGRRPPRRRRRARSRGSRPLDALEQHRARTVAEEDERRAVGPVEDPREHVAADDERALREPGGDHPVAPARPRT